MDTLIRELLTTGGPLGVLVVVVWIFVKDRRENSMEHRAWMDSTIKNSSALITQMHNEHLDARTRMQVCLERNTLAMDNNTRAMMDLSSTVAVCPLEKKAST